MDRLTKGLDRLNVSRGAGEEDEWRTVGSPGGGKRSQNQLMDNNMTKTDPIIISHNCPFSIYQMPKFCTDESILRLVNNVAETGPETMRLLLEISLETYPKQLVILRGVPGSGKSSVATALMATTRKGTICSADDYFKDGKGNYNFNPGRLQDAHYSCQTKCRKLMEKESSPVIIDNTNTRRFEMEPYVRLAIENNYAVNVFEPETSWKNDARILAQKNIHGVPRGKIQEMIDRFEQVLPFLVVEDVRKRMGDVGRRYNPVRANFDGESGEQPPLLGATRLEALIPPSMALTLKQQQKEKEANHNPLGHFQYPISFNNPPPTPLLSEFVLNSLASPAAHSLTRSGGTLDGGIDGACSRQQSSRMAAVFPSDNEEKVINTDPDSSSREGKNYCLTDQNVSLSTGGRMKRRGRSSAAAAAASSAAGGSPMENLLPQKKSGATIPSKPYSESLLKSAEILQAYFPTYKIDDLADLLDKFDEDINEAMNALLDSGYSMAEEVVLMDENVASTATQSAIETTCPSNDLNQQQIHHDRHSDSPASSEIIGASPADSSPTINDNDTGPLDPDWFNLQLPHEFIKKLASMYGQPDDPIIQAMIQNKGGYQTQLPPGLGFAMYRKLIQNAETKAFKEAEDAAKD